MRCVCLHRVLALLLILSNGLYAGGALAAGLSDGENAVDLLGQYDETSMSAPVPSYTRTTANNAPNRLGFSASYGVAYDTSNFRLFVVDQTNVRVLVYAMNSDGTFVDRVPDNVLGQPDFYSKNDPSTIQQNNMKSVTGLAYDTDNNRLFVGQHNNSSRVTVYDVTSITNGENAANILGAAYGGGSPGTTQNGMNYVNGVAYDSVNNRLFVSQEFAHRITVYDILAITDGENATNVLGQINFTAASAATTQSGLNGPQGIAYDNTNNRFFSTDRNNNRVVVYDVLDITNGENATNVLGQPNYTRSTGATQQNSLNNPIALAYDSGNNRLFVSMTTAHRVMVYDVADITDGENATNVLGQPNYLRATAAAQQNGVSNPIGIAYDSTNNRLFVSQSTNAQRVTVYDIAAITDGENAVDLVGQFDETNYPTPVPHFSKGTINNAPNRLGFSFPIGVAYDAGNNRLFVAEQTNNRVLVYAMNGDGTFVDRIPDNIIGQVDYYTVTAHVAQNRLNAPQALAYDSTNNRLFVSQSTARRVTVYDVAAITDGENATNVLGQPTYTANTAATQQNGMNTPKGVEYDSTNNRLFVADSAIARVTVYDILAITDGENATNVLGQPNYLSALNSFTQQDLLYGPRGIVYDNANNRLFVSDGGINRVTVYDITTIVDGENATNILGQPNYTISTGTTQQNGMNIPQGLAYDSTNKWLFVGQQTSKRITVYDVTAITDGENAINVLGQPSFTSATAATTQNGVSLPQYMTYDATNGRLFMADSTLNRVSIYDVIDPVVPPKPTRFFFQMFEF